MNLDLARGLRSSAKLRSERARTRISGLMEALWVTGHVGVTAEQIDRWIASRRFFFILAIGRSGTTFLAHLLDLAADAVVVHEPNYSDIDAYRRAFFSPGEAERYIASFRKKEMYLRTRGKDFAVYGEVNSLLRRHCQALRRHFPAAGFLHLVRDGRDVVRTMMSTVALHPADMWTGWLRPPRSDPFFAQWRTMDRFARLCWYWRVENQYLRACIGTTVRFEEIARDYERLQQRVLTPLGLSLPHSVWKEQAGVQRNATSNYRMPHWHEWDARHTETFESICGDEMRANGYGQ